jgi:hypothetical protein
MLKRSANAWVGAIAAAAVLVLAPPMAPAAVSQAVAAPAPTKEDIARKIRFVRMMATQSKMAYRLEHSGDPALQKEVNRARDLVEAAQASLDAGDADGADKQADKSLELISAAAKRLPANSREDNQLRYKELLDAVTTYQASYDSNYKRMVAAKGVTAVGTPLDEARFNDTVAKARAAADKGDLEGANLLLARAQRDITKALTVLLKGQTLVYEKKFATPQDEYNYEAARNKSYADLVPRALEQHHPTEHAVELIHQFVDLSASMETKAAQQAQAGEYKDAIQTMQVSTSHLQRALWIAGVRWSKWPE